MLRQRLGPKAVLGEDVEDEDECEEEEAAAAKLGGFDTETDRSGMSQPDRNKSPGKISTLIQAPIIEGDRARRFVHLPRKHKIFV